MFAHTCAVMPLYPGTYPHSIDKYILITYTFILVKLKFGSGKLLNVQISKVKCYPPASWHKQFTSSGTLYLICAYMPHLPLFILLNIDYH